MGTSSHGNISLLLSLLLFSVLVSKCSSITTVQINNDIDVYEATLDMHCMSNDDDLGQRWLHQGEEWHWQFHAIEGLTYFWCDFRWYDNLNYLWYNGTFDVYHANGLIDKYKHYYCGNDCPYSARRDGFYLYRSDKDAWEKRDEWHAE
ncbi:hypothetical protein MKX01_029625 [Papaver californicum]|nr:hypothetical protein MKX01_029625 [Papaver californicum]